MISVFNSGLSGAGLSPRRRLLVVFLGKTLLSECFFPPRHINGNVKKNVNLIYSGHDALSSTSAKLS